MKVLNASAFPHGQSPTGQPLKRVADCIRPVIPQPTEGQHIGNQINAALIFARADFVKVHR
jgi:hypothetical protein